MRDIFLPTLKKIKIKNFTLYPNGLDFEYDFINGVNLIIGGNGMGKTTLVNIIKYSIIGNYSKQYEHIRNYLDKAIISRIQFPEDYFSSRMNNTIALKEKPSVTIQFYINETLFEIERCLEDISIKSVYIDNVMLEGEIIKQKKYENLDDGEKLPFLQKKYEDKIFSISKIPFDDLIFFTNEILFFGEDHKTVLWDEYKTQNVQNELLNKYFNSPELNKKREDAKNKAKHYDSLSRHRSEDKRAINKVLKDINKENAENSNGDEVSINEKILELKSKIEKKSSKIEKTEDDRLLIEDKIRILNNDNNQLSINENQLDKDLKIAEDKMIVEKWEKLHKNYDIYLQNLKTNKSCPMCNKTVEGGFVLNKIEYANNCFLCNQEINQITNEELSNSFIKIGKKIEDVYTKIQNTIKEIKNEEKKLNELDATFKDLNSEKKDLQAELRRMEFANSKDDDKKSDELQAFYDELSRLDELIAEYKEKSKGEKNKEDSFTEIINKTISKNTTKFSNLFAEFAGRFLGVECSLTYTNSGSGNRHKRFYPVIDGKIRYHEEQLSESQRFFVDHSFRMSVLSFFYVKPTFYIVETPDSSLDISYEKNAAEVFIKFLENPNSLIITSNLNNSSFLNHLIDITEVKMISLLEIGKKSIIQNASETLKSIYNQIKNKINHG